MASSFTPRLEILPAAQRRLWNELGATPPEFTLYGGTAIALRLGHRQSADFDFFSQAAFEPRQLLARVAYLEGAVLRQSAANTLSVTVDRGGPVQLSYFGNLGLGQVALSETVAGPWFKVAALIDVAGTKAAVVTQRAELRDYLDIHALLTAAGLTLAEMLAAAAIIYGPQFNPLLALKAISYLEDPALNDLPSRVRNDLIDAVRTTDPRRLPGLDPVRTWGRQ